MGLAILSHRVEMVHQTQDLIPKKVANVILDLNHLTITEMEIAHDKRSYEKNFVMLGITLINY